jgi:hypothetical protein
MGYRKTSPAPQDAVDALRAAESALTRAGFRIVTQTPTSLEALGLPPRRRNGEALAWADTVRVDIQGGVLSLQAELGAWTKFWHLWLMATIIIPLPNIYALLDPQGIGFTMVITAGILLLAYLVLGFGCLVWKIRCLRALDVLLARMASPEPAAR